MERGRNRAGRSPKSGEPVFLVLEGDPLIADDIMGSLKDIGPCRVLRASDSSNIAAMLNEEDRIAAAFLDLPFSKVLEDGLDQRLTAYGARIVLTVGENDQHRALARGWGMLIRPFTDEMIRDVVMPKPLD